MLMYVPVVYGFLPEINVFVFVTHENSPAEGSKGHGNAVEGPDLVWGNRVVHENTHGRKASEGAHLVDPHAQK